MTSFFRTEKFDGDIRNVRRRDDLLMLTWVPSFQIENRRAGEELFWLFLAEGVSILLLPLFSISCRLSSFRRFSSSPLMRMLLTPEINGDWITCEKKFSLSNRDQQLSGCEIFWLPIPFSLRSPKSGRNKSVERDSDASTLSSPLLSCCAPKFLLFLNWQTAREKKGILLLLQMMIRMRGKEESLQSDGEEEWNKWRGQKS